MHGAFTTALEIWRAIKSVAPDPPHPDRSSLCHGRLGGAIPRRRGALRFGLVADIEPGGYRANTLSDESEH